MKIYFKKTYIITSLFIAISCGFSTSESLYEKGVELSNKKKYKEAIKYYSKAIELDEDHAKAWYARGIAYYQLQDIDNAYINCKQSVMIDRFFKKSLKCFADTAFDKKKYMETLRASTLLIKQEPKNANTYNQMGLAWELLGDETSGLEAYLKAIEIDNTKDYIFDNISSVYRKQKNYKKALFYVNKAFDLEEKPEYLFSKILILNKLNQYEESFESIKSLKNLGFTIPLENFNEMKNYLNNVNLLIAEYDDFYDEILQLRKKGIDPTKK